MGYLCGSAGKEFTCNVNSIPGLGRSPGERKGCPLQYSGLENSMDCTHGVTELDVTLTFFIMEKEMATHSSTLAWKIPWMEEPGRLQSMGS